MSGSAIGAAAMSSKPELMLGRMRWLGGTSAAEGRSPSPLAPSDSGPSDQRLARATAEIGAPQKPHFVTPAWLLLLHSEQRGPTETRGVVAIGVGSGAGSVGLSMTADSSRFAVTGDLST